MKSQQLDVMLKEWEAAYVDGRLACATTVVESERDIARLRLSVTNRGIHTFVLDLPLLDDLVLSLLENGVVNFSGPFTGRKSKGDRRPRFLWAFWSLVCDADGCLLKEPCSDALRALRMLACQHKKLEVKCSDDRIKKAVEEFHEIEKQISPPVLNWSGDFIDVASAPRFRESFGDDGTPGLETLQWNQFLQRLDNVAAILVSGLPTFDSMSEQGPEHGEFRHGRGAVSNRRRNEYKYEFPSWSDKLEGVFPFDWCSGQPLGSYPPSRREGSSKLGAVPKTAKGPRLIASEPVEHQWCQQKLFTFLDYHIKNSLLGKFIALHDQKKSQAMVASASIDRSFCTIDLSSASDRISCRHIESLMRVHHPLLEAFHAVRTRFWVDGVLDKQRRETRKFTTMGSALTFPVQCIFFLSVTLASAGAYDLRSIKDLIGKVRVFGDDIIAPNCAYGAVTSNLERLGLKVNLRKSFTKGYFRESCGADYWCGFDITPVKPKVALPLTPEEFGAIRDTSNNYYLKGYWRTAEAYASLLPSGMTGATFAKDSGVPGLLSYMGRSEAPLKWCPRLHVWYTRILVDKTPVKRVSSDSIAMLSEHFTRAHSGLNPRQLGITNKGRSKLGWLRVVA